MTARSVAVWAGVVAGIALIGKVVVMTVQGGPEPETSVPENIAFFVGNLALPVAVAATAVHLTRGRPVLLRVAAAVLAVVGVALLVLGVQAALTALPGEAWWQGESVFGLVGTVALALSLLASQRGPTGAGPTHDS